MEGWWRGDRETQTVSETDREMGGGGVVVEGDTVSETDREMGGGGVVEVAEGRQRDTDSERDRQRDGGWRGDRHRQ